MIEKTVLDYLSTKLGVPVYAEKPTNKPIEYVLIKYVDGGRINHIDNASFYIESISTSMVNASKLNKQVMDAMFDFVSVDGISSSKLGGANQYIDQATKTYAYQCVFNLIYTED